jgi:hypothetical protein
VEPGPLIMRRRHKRVAHRVAPAPRPVLKKATPVLKAKAPDPGLLAENEAIAINREHWAGRSHKFIEAEWTAPNGHPRCVLCGQEERIDGMCSPVTKADGNTDAGNLDSPAAPIQGTASFRQRHGVHPYEALLHPPEGVSMSEIVKALIVAGLEKRAVTADVEAELAKALERKARRESGADWLSDYGHQGDQAEEARRRTTPAPSVYSSDPEDPVSKRGGEFVEFIKSAPGYDELEQRMQQQLAAALLDVARFAEATETLKAINADRQERGLRPFDTDVIKHWRPRLDD